MTDQQRADAMGCAGNPILRTPAMDAIAASGVRFTDACASTPVCVASRMSFITGHRAARTHWVDNSALPGPVPELPTMMSLLLRAGYWTHGVGKMHFRGRSYGFRNLLTMEEGVAHRVDDDYLRYLRDAGVEARFPKGFRDLLYFQPQTSGVPVEHSASNWVADRSIEFLREHARYRSDQPFFLWSSWIAPHPPFAPSEPYDTLYDPEAMPLPEYADRPVGDLPSALWSHRARLDGAHRDPDRMRRIRALYYGLIGQVDDGIARIMAVLRELGLEQNTVVLFTADHGEMLGDHGLSQKNCPYEPSVRVPLLLRWPGRTHAGTTCDDPVGLTDVLPTMVAELDLDYPADQGPLPGESLLGVPGGGLASRRGDYVIDYGQGPRRWIAVRTRRHKVCAVRLRRRTGRAVRPALRSAGADQPGHRPTGVGHRVPRARPGVGALLRLGPRAGGRRLIQRGTLPHLAGAGDGSLRGGTARRDGERRAVAEARSRRRGRHPGELRERLHPRHQQGNHPHPRQALPGPLQTQDQPTRPPRPWRGTARRNPVGASLARRLIRDERSAARRFYRTLIRKADERFDRHLTRVAQEGDS